MYGKLTMKANRFKRFPIKKGVDLKLVWSAAFLSFFYVSCLPFSDKVHYANGFMINDENVCLAVMNFDYSGYGLSSKLALNTADNITSELFIQKKAHIVDRNLVRDVLNKDENIKRDQYSRDDIKRIGNHLDATHIIFGSLYATGTLEGFFESDNYHVDLTLRIVAVDSGNVVGVIKQSASNENIEVLLKKLVKKVINSL
jgi:hypothetical protein